MELPPPVIAKTAFDADVALTQEERLRHAFILGKSGSGKSTVLFNLAMHDISAGHGVAVIDPHGDLAEAVIDAVPARRTHEVCYLNVADRECPVGFNPLAGVSTNRRALAASGIVSAFKHVFRDSWGPRLEYWLYNGVAALLESPRPSLIELPRLYTDDAYRQRIVNRIEDPVVARFWRYEFESYDQRFRAEAASPILNKVGQIAASPVLRNILGQTSPKFDLEFAMEHRRILIANLSKGHIGEQASNLLGSLLVSHLQLIAMARSDLAPEKRAPFFFHTDEFSNFSTDAFASLVSEARKFAIGFALAGQFLEQAAPEVRAAILGNVGTLMVFSVSSRDAELLAPEFHPLPAHELVDQRPFTAWLRRSSAGHQAIFLEPPLFESKRRATKILEQSRRNFGRPRSTIERSLS